MIEDYFMFIIIGLICLGCLVFGWIYTKNKRKEIEKKIKCKK